MNDNADVHYFNNPKNITGFKFGAFAAFNMGAGFFLNPELNFVRKGENYKNSWRNDTYFYTYDYQSASDNIELPVNLLYKVHTGAGNILAGSGPVFEYLGNVLKNGWCFFGKKYL